jgi:DNA adenine methylase
MTQPLPIEDPADTGLQSPIKWPGGKSKEYAFIKHLIPPFRRYIEPFFGGGAVFFRLRPHHALINDFSVDLINYYRFLKGDLDREAFARELYAYVDNWEKVSAYLGLFEDEFIRFYHQYKHEAISADRMQQSIAASIKAKEAQFNGLFAAAFCLSTDNLVARITANLQSKIHRIKDLERQKGSISPEDLEKNIETAFRSGFYMHFRDVLNGKFDHLGVSQAKKTANYYFIREFCYGAMFRYNAAGEFNIPYGGIAYNTKDFRKKVDTMLSPGFTAVFDGCQMESGDFEGILTRPDISADDFIFLDPPYDSDFSDYDNQAFGQADHIRLAECLYATKAKWLLLIKETPFIRALYERPGIRLESFEKKYLYNVKNRNKQDVTHLIIYNYGSV